MAKFKKGQSGNPGGRPKQLGEVRDYARGHTVEAIDCLIGIMNERRQSGSARVAAACAVLDRGWGKPLQRMEMGDPGEFERMSDAELDQALRDEVVRLGIGAPTTAH